MERAIGVISANYITKGMDGLTKTRTIASLPFGAKYRMIDFSISSMVHSDIVSIGVVIPTKSRSLLNYMGHGKDWKLERKVGGLFFLPEVREHRDRSSRNFLLQDLCVNREFLTHSQAPYVVFSFSHMVFDMDYRPVLDQAEKTNADIVFVCANKVQNEANCLRVITDKSGKVTTLHDGGDEGKAFIDTFVIRRELLLGLISQNKKESIMVIINEQLDKWKAQTYLHEGYVGNISSVADYYRCSQDILTKEVQQELFLASHNIMTKMHDNNPTKFHKDSVVTNTIITAGCDIKGTIENSIVFRGVEIEEGAVVKNSILFPGVHIGANAQIMYAILDKKADICENATVIGSKEDLLVVEKEATSATSDAISLSKDGEIRKLA